MGKVRERCGREKEREERGRQIETAFGERNG